VDVDELVGLGAQGLVDAARRFDAGRGVPFAAYARPRVQGAMLDGLRALGTTPSAVLRAGAAGDVAARYSARFASARAAGLLAETTDQPEGPVPTAPSDETPEAVALRRELRRLLTEAVGGLTPVEQALVVRCGLGDEPLEHVALALNLSAERGRQRYRRALLRLRARLRADL
jgi:RNA polymerase sigma factor for flagellar operon FliA